MKTATKLCVLCIAAMILFTLAACAESSDTGNVVPEVSPAPIAPATKTTSDPEPLAPDLMSSDSWPKAVSNDAQMADLSKSDSSIRVVGEVSPQALLKGLKGRHFEYISLNPNLGVTDAYAQAIASALKIDRLDIIFRSPGAEAPDLMSARWSSLLPIILASKNIGKLHLDCDPAQWQNMPSLDARVV